MENPVKEDIIKKKINELNKTLQTIDIKGKDYVEVNKRVEAFRQVFPLGTIETTIEHKDNNVVIMKATVKNEGQVLSTGYAQEKEDSSFINKTSYIENCETSAVGRALGFLGIGINTSIASYEEVSNAIKNQIPKPKRPTDLITDNQKHKLFELVGMKEEDKTLIREIMGKYGYLHSDEIKKTDLKDIIEEFKLAKKNKENSNKQRS